MSTTTADPTTRSAADGPDLAPLIDALPDGAVITEVDSMAGYRMDWAKDPNAGTPLVVVRATCTEDVATAITFAAEHGISVVPRGAGTGLSGGASALEGCMVLSTERMRDIRVDPVTRTCVVQPGLLNAEVKKACAEHDLWYPPDPSSYEICSIGGNVATNAGGLCCVKYGVTTDYVLGLDVVLSDGTLVTLGGKRIKDVAGLSLLKLFVGSEGTLGIVTRAILRLVPLPLPPATLVASFASVVAAAEAVVAVRRTLRPSMMELMDRATINAVEDFSPRGLDRTAGALLIVQSDAPGDARVAEIAAVEAACAAAGATEVVVTDDPAEGEMFVEARRMAFPAVEARGSLLLEDVGAAVPLLPDLLAAVAAIAASHDLEIPTVAHAGDGNTHPIIVYDATDPDSERRARAAFDDILRAAIRLGGTITGEHGVGRTKKAALPDQLGEDVMALSRRIKDALDPDGILNPGAVL